MRKLNYSLRELYRTLEQPGDNPLRDARARLDAAVRAAYRMPADADPLAFLLEFNLVCAAKEKAAEKLRRPGCRPKSRLRLLLTIAFGRPKSDQWVAAVEKCDEPTRPTGCITP